MKVLLVLGIFLTFVNIIKSDDCRNVCESDEICVKNTCKPEEYCEKDDDCGDYLYCENNKCGKEEFPFPKYRECLRKKALSDIDNFIMKIC